MQPIVPAALSELQTWVGTSGRHPDLAQREAWARTLLPHDNVAWALRYLEARGAEARGQIVTSTCALVVLRFFGLLGCKCRERSIAYTPRAGQAVADVERIARRHGAWLTSTEALATYPKPGDVLCMRVENPHVAVVVGSRAEDGAILSIDGGQRDNTWTLERARILIADGTVKDLDDGVSTTVGRISKLYARVDGAKIAASLELCR